MTLRELLCPPGATRQDWAVDGALATALAQPDVKAKFAGAGAEVHPLSPTEFASFVRTENEKWSRLIRERKLQLD